MSGCFRNCRPDNPEYELNGKNGRDKSKKSCSVLGRRDEGKGIRREK